MHNRSEDRLYKGSLCGWNLEKIRLGTLDLPQSGRFLLDSPQAAAKISYSHLSPQLTKGLFDGTLNPNRIRADATE